MFKILGNFIQKLIDVIGVALDFLVGIFPPSPFTILESAGFGELIAKINFFIPVYEFLAIAQSWLIAIGIYYLYSIYARWVKAIH